MKMKFVVSALLVMFLLFGTYKLMNARAFQLFGGLVSEVKTGEKEVALTFDDGPNSNVDPLLQLLDKYNAKATFFLIGKDIEKHPEEAKKLVEAGHQLGNHTYSHERMVFKSPSYIKSEIEKTDQLIRESGFDGEIDFRPPNGKKLVGLPYYLKKNQRETIMWSLEPDSYYEKASEKVKYVKENVEPGSIILMHPMYGQTETELKAVEGILSGLTELGYNFVTVEELQSK
ncbi:polysaccharide deacetylase family protein [Bacillus sp. B-jedd]|uniref:polysaccharide deacetylase family protein n=1 Tax=Bacillus sp. B-jedd TaxID=1476857 RepID=UPI0005157058|nr:polysaccharide deacetylase family protein [Bacillus sp. B-jedd]CEG25711.1 polysaccharide deacetylase [Bacillus sp. B-jedd]